MEFDLSKPQCFYFNEIAKIPHGSYNEKGISDYLVKFAQDRDLNYLQDKYYNVIIYAPASSGYQQAEPLLIQAHMDMVAEANKNTAFDFKKDPLDLYVEDGWLKAKGTTLGADDGTGVAYMLALLDGQYEHPALECCFTVSEEVGLVGAMKLKKEYFHAKRMISLDGGGEVSTCISAAGGVIVTSTLIGKKVKNDKPTYSLFVSGLLGGHSGGEINKEKGNSIKLAVRIIKEMLLSGVDLNLIKIAGGLKDNAIPRECEIVFAASDDFANSLKKSIANIKEELEFSDSGFKCEVTNIRKSLKCFDKQSTSNLIDYIYLLPNGFKNKSMAIPGLTLTSLNTGIIKTQFNKIVVTSSLRSAIESGKDNLVNEINTLAAHFGYKTKLSASYPGWNYKSESDMRQKLRDVLAKRGIELQEQAAHGGNECGIFNSLGIEDIVTYGPITQYIHTPDEQLDLASFDRSFETLLDLIKECK